MPIESGDGERQVTAHKAMSNLLILPSPSDGQALFRLRNHYRIFLLLREQGTQLLFRNGVLETPYFFKLFPGLLDDLLLGGACPWRNTNFA
jgi:hypothetical protein